jgi:hypothetical protein
MDGTDSGEPQGGQERLGLGAAPTLEQLAGAAQFPIYGLLQAPTDLTVHGVEYHIVDAGFGEPAPVADTDAQAYLLQVGLEYRYPAGHQEAGKRLEITTTGTTRPPMVPPMLAPSVEDVLREHAMRYAGDDEIPPVGSAPRSFVIERYAIVGGEAVVAVDYAPERRPIRGRLLGVQAHHLVDANAAAVAKLLATSPPASPEWTLTLRNAELWVQVQAYGWAQSELFAALHQLGVISDKPEIVNDYRL